MVALTQPKLDPALPRCVSADDARSAAGNHGVTNAWAGSKAQVSCPQYCPLRSSRPVGAASVREGRSNGEGTGSHSWAMDALMTKGGEMQIPSVKVEDDSYQGQYQNDPGDRAADHGRRVHALGACRRKERR